MCEKSLDNVSGSPCLATTSGIPWYTSIVLSNFQFVANSANNTWSVHRGFGIPCSANKSFKIDIVFAALQSDTMIL